jgi:hypothetical protein
MFPDAYEHRFKRAADHSYANRLCVTQPMYDC